MGSSNVHVSSDSGFFVRVRVILKFCIGVVNELVQNSQILLVLLRQIQIWLNYCWVELDDYNWMIRYEYRRLQYDVATSDFFDQLKLGICRH